MRIGTIAQHANVGPTSNKSILPNGAVPGRLNDFPIWAWWDFTDSSQVVFNSPDLVTTVYDKGPYGAHLSSKDSENGPAFKKNLGQDFYSYIETSGVNDWFSFTNPAILSLRDMSIVVIHDITTTNLAYPDEEYLIRIQGSGNQKLDYRWRAHSVFFTIPVATYTNTSNSASTMFDTGGQEGDLDEKRGGDFNYNFNWLAASFRSSQREFYTRGLSNIISGDPWADDTLPKGSTSVLFAKDPNGVDRPLEAKIYEFIIFEKALTTKQFYNIDMYIKNKYSSYAYGRINGHTS